jgi:hypothetical protein
MLTWSQCARRGEKWPDEHIEKVRNHCQLICCTDFHVRIAGKKSRGQGCGRVRKEEAEGVADAWIYKKSGPR